MRVVPRSGRRGLAALGVAAALLLAGGTARAQDNPVFLDDSTLASDVLAGLPGLLASENRGEAVRLLQQLLSEEGERLIATDSEPDLLEPVRGRVHRVLLADEGLLERYREAESIVAERMLEAGEYAQVERTRLLTRAGFAAAVEAARAHLVAGRFEAARLALVQLENHPDRAEPELAAMGAGVWRELAAYLPREGVVAAAERWAEAAGEPFDAPEPVALPEALAGEVLSPREPVRPFDLTDLVNAPLCSADLRPGAEAAPEERPLPTRRSGSLAELPYLYPVVSGDTVYTNDGLWVCAWDRFTLSERWRVKPRGADLEREELEAMYASDPYRRNRSRDAEESNTLALTGRVLLAATGVVTDGTRTGDPRLHAIDARTGEVLWSSYIDELDERLEMASTRGPALVEGDVAVVAVRKIDQSRRFASVFLVGLDLADGSARWVRLCGSAGWLAYGGRGQWSDWPALHEGVVYRVDELGVICAVEAGTGRFRWARRLDGVESRLPSDGLPWASSSPVFDGDTLLTLSPDRRHLLRVDLASGRIVSRRDAQIFGSPGYIFGHQGRLVLVSPTRVATAPLQSAAEDGPIVLSKRIESPDMHGRVVAGGDKLVVPLQTGVGVLDFRTLESVRGLVLKEPGTALPVGSQLLTLDNQQVHSYLVWEDASTVLAARLEANPGDVETAITFAELAARAERPASMLGAVDRALSAMAADPLGPSVRGAQRRLFDLLLGIVRAGLEGPEAGLVPPVEVVEGAAARLGSVAVTSDERATSLLLTARLERRLGRAREAAAALQRVLGDPDLASASWSRGASSVRAELEALAALDELVGEAGPGVYAAQESAALAELGRLEAEGAPASAFERLARAYPRSSAAPAAWARVASAEGVGALARDRALSRGIESAARNRALGMPVDEVVVGELLGRRLVGLLEAERLDAAAEVLERIESAWPGVSATSGGEAVDLAGAREALRERASMRFRRAEVGTAFTGAAEELRGWVLMRALDRRDALADRGGVMMLGPGKVALWRSSEGAGLVEPAWEAPTGEATALVRHGRDRVLLFEPVSGGTMRALDPADGSELWRAAGLREALATAQGAGLGGAARERFDSPLDGSVDASELMLALDETTAAVITRSGRVVAVDLTSGRIVWARRTACRRVHDGAAGDGVLVLGGTSSAERDDSAGEPLVLVLDLATGEEISRYAPGQGATGGDVRWVHVESGAGRAVVGTARGLASLSLPDAVVLWTVADPLVEQTAGAWSGGGRLFVQTSMRELVVVDGASGSEVAERPDTADALELGEPIDAVAEEGRLMLLSPAGYAALDAATGRLAAADAIEPITGSLVQPALGRERLAMVQREPVPGEGGMFRLHLLEASSGRATESVVLALGDRPRRVALLEGVVLITTGDSTFAVETE